MKTILKRTIRIAIYAIMLFIMNEITDFHIMLAFGIAIIIAQLDELNMKI